MTSVSAGHIILTPTQPVGNGRPQRESNPGPPHQESHALPTELPHPLSIYKKMLSHLYSFLCVKGKYHTHIHTKQKLKKLFDCGWLSLQTNGLSLGQESL